MDGRRLRRRGYNIAALRLLAKRRLPRVVFDFVDGGAEDETTLRANEAAFRDIALLPHPLDGTSQRDQSVELFGERLAGPVLIGPTGLSGLLWRRGEAAAARAAAAAGTVYVMSHASTVSIEALAGGVSGPLWMQVFVYTDRGLTRAFVERARAAGYRALVLTIDNQLGGQRERDIRNDFTIPPRWRAGNLLDVAWHLPWLLHMARGPRVTMANYRVAGRSDVLSVGTRLVSLLDPGLSWADVEWLRREWDRPFLLKGVLHPQEARRAVEMGVDGIIVSNHGGRQLDGAPAAVRALPAVVDAVDGRVPVLVDGGIRRGSDVVKALALGARACLVARPHLWGLAVAGEAGVAWVLEILRRDIDRTMGLCGVERIADIDRGLLFATPWARAEGSPGSQSRPMARRA
ncbi:MAG: alpha-hydroxy-acid oxidizing protein [Rhodospirillaceae bacterium]|nr:alpha-hydroxy-acid oxidizing protein [Rhodospirillaceae bacterium]